MTVIPTWQTLLRRLVAHESLTTAETQWAMHTIMSGEASQAQLAAFVVALRAKGENAQEVRGFVQAMLDHAIKVPFSGTTLDIVGTGGDSSQSVNVSTMSSIVCAAAGARVVKHGNRAATSKCGSADVLEELGIAIDVEPQEVPKILDEVGIAFCFAPTFHSSMRHAAAARKEIGIPTVFNILGPLANPARPSAQLIGCADTRLAPVMAQVLADFGVKALVVRGDDGLDEVTTTGRTRIWDVRSGDVEETEIDAADYGIKRATVADLRGGDAAYNADIVRRLLSNEDSAVVTPIRDAVVINSALALIAYDAALGAQGDIHELIPQALIRAERAISDGSALKILQAWTAVSTR